ncbi:MAG: endonuclease, partial [Pseudonocardiales bacterium]|nr:endonuclease [Pseudonocardiales bacterium]
MPEGDTVWLTAHRLDQALAGRALTVCDFRVPALATVDLTGRTVTEVLARGKHILTRVEDDLTVHSHLRMDGSWYLSRGNGPTPRRHPQHLIRALLGN